MTKEIRQGLGLLCVAAVCALVGIPATGDVERIANPAAVLFGIGGLLVLAVSLFRRA